MEQTLPNGRSGIPSLIRFCHQSRSMLGNTCCICGAEDTSTTSRWLNMVCMTHSIKFLIWKPAHGSTAEDPSTRTITLSQQQQPKTTCYHNLTLTLHIRVFIALQTFVLRKHLKNFSRRPMDCILLWKAIHYRKCRISGIPEFHGTAY